jgi:hypothetical protein
MLGKSSGPGGIADALGGYEALLDEVLGDDAHSAHGLSPWIGTEEDILVMMMQREPGLFSPVRSGDCRGFVTVFFRRVTSGSDAFFISNNCIHAPLPPLPPSFPQMYPISSTTAIWCR